MIADTWRERAFCCSLAFVEFSFRKAVRGQKNANRVLAIGRAPVEHGFAHLKSWRVLTKLRPRPRHPPPAGLLVLTSLEVNR